MEQSTDRENRMKRLVTVLSVIFSVVFLANIVLGILGPYPPSTIGQRLNAPPAYPPIKIPFVTLIQSYPLIWVPLVASLVLLIVAGLFLGQTTRVTPSVRRDIQVASLVVLSGIGLAALFV
jgi:hypothetical protein